MKSSNKADCRPLQKAVSIIPTIFLIFMAILTLFPIYMCLLNSFKTNGEIINNILKFPDHFRTENYVTTFINTGYLRSLFNTIVIVVIGLCGIILFSSLAGYKLSRTHTKLSSLLFNFFIFAMLIPFSSVMISLTKIAKDLNAQGSIVGLGLIYIGLGCSMAIFLYHGFVKSIPTELDEAALIDGCGPFKTFFVIIFPLLRPITATIAIINTLWMWNDFLLPLIMLPDSSQYTLLLSTNMLFGEYGNNDWSSILDALIMAMLPMVVFYLLLQKYIMKGLAEGAIKG